MSGYSVKRIDEMEGIYLGAFKLARAELDVSSFGLAIIDFPPNYDAHPEHDHVGDGQEEVYLALRGAGEIEIEGERHPLDPDHIARVSADTKRKILAGPEGVRVLAIGGVPGRAYEITEFSQLGRPDPMAAGA